MRRCAQINRPLIDALHKGVPPALRPALATISFILGRPLLWGCAFGAVWYFLPSLALGPTEGDFSHSLLRAFATMSGVKPGTAFWTMFWHDAQQRGMLLPLRAVPLCVWLIPPPERVLRVIQLILVGCNFATFGWLCRRMRGNGFAVVCVAIALVSLQARKWHDPVTGNALVMPIVAECVLMALGLLIAFAQTRKSLYAIGAAFCAIAAAFIDPLGVAMCAVFAVAAVPLIPPRARVWLPLALAGGAGVAVYISLRALHNHFAGAVIMQSFPQQLVAALPASYRVLGGLISDRVVSFAYDSRFDSIPNAAPLDGIVALIIATISGIGLYFANRKVSGVTWRFFPGLIGLGIWVGAAFAAIPWAGHRLAWGDAYDGIYIEAFGFALFASWLLGAIMQQFSGKGAGKLHLIVAIGFGASVFLFLIGNIRFNSFVFAKDQAVLTRRYVLQHAAESGLFEPIASGATIALPRKEFDDYGISVSAGYSGASSYFYSLTKQRYGIESIAEKSSPPAGLWLFTTAMSPETDMLTLTKIQTLIGKRALSKRARAYVWAFYRPALQEMDIARTGRQSGIEKAVQIAGPRSLIVNVVRTCGPTQAGNVLNPDAPAATFGSGFRRRFPDPDVRLVAAGPLNPNVPNWRYGDKVAEIHVKPGQCASRHIVLDADAYVREPGHVRVSFAGKTLDIFASQLGGHLHLVLPGNKPVTVTLAADTTPLDADMQVPRYDYVDRGPAYILIAHLSVASETR